GLKFPLDDKIQIRELEDTALIGYMGEGLEVNRYFMKEFNSKTVYPFGITELGKHNMKYCKTVAQLFGQINKWEKVQALALAEVNTEYVQNRIKAHKEEMSREERFEFIQEKIR